METEAVTVPEEAERERLIAGAFERERPGLESWLRRHAPSAEDVEDLLQEAFCELFVAYRATQPIRHAGAWLYRVVRNRLIDQFRRRKADSLEAMEQDGTDVEKLLLDPAPGPEQSLAWAALLLELETALAELPDPQREVFVAQREALKERCSRGST